MKFGPEIIKRRTVVEISWRETERGPIHREEYWFRVLPLAAFEDLVPRIRALLGETEKKAGADWNQQFNTAPVGKRRKL